VLTVCGSLQAVSANRAALDVASEAARARGATVADFDALAAIPAFNPDLDDPAPDPVTRWRTALADHDTVIIAAPEYAGALPGALKNALDWIVGSGQFYGKPVALITAGSTGGHLCRAMLVQTLTFQGARIVAELAIAAPRTKSDAAGRFTDPATLVAIAAVVDGLLDDPGPN
jgi:chromate reductase